MYLISNEVFHGQPPVLCIGAAFKIAQRNHDLNCKSTTFWSSGKCGKRARGSRGTYFEFQQIYNYSEPFIKSRPSNIADGTIKYHEKVISTSGDVSPDE